MRSKAKGRWIDAALKTMVLSNQRAAECLQEYGATACTDLTGFGLLGHLVEMTRASAVDAMLYMDQLPILDGAQETVAAGILSSLHPQNLRLRRALQDFKKVSLHPVFPLLFDPQTVGGLLAGVPQKRADDGAGHFTHAQREPLRFYQFKERPGREEIIEFIEHEGMLTNR